MYKTILAPLDGSEYSECSLEHVRAIAKGCHASEVILLMVVEPPQQVYALSEDQLSEALETITKSSEKPRRAILRKALSKAKANAKKYIQNTAESLQKDGIDVRAVVVQGRPAEKILDYTKRNQVDIIIMSTHGRAGITRWVFGSVADKVARRSAVPVLIIPPMGCRQEE